MNLRFDLGTGNLSCATVSETLPFITVIVPARPDQREVQAVAAVACLEYPAARLELLLVRGRQPAVQRNVAIREARGEFIYFLDDDAAPWPGNLQIALQHFQRPEVKMVGGPNLCPSQAPLLERVFAVVLASALAFGPSRARYDQVGAARESGEKELILCNLMARRADLLEAGGFDEALYPNEENALMDDLQRRGGKLIYDPGFVAQRRPRPTLRAFVRMLMAYGRGRAEQFRLHPTPGSILNFVPPLFCLYLAVAPWFGWMALTPLVLYALAVLSQTVGSAVRREIGLSLLAAPLIVLTHVCYGLGFWRGLFTRLKKAAAFSADQVTIEKIATDICGEEETN